MGSTVDANKSSYGSGLLQFTQFCDEHEIPEEAQLPADQVILTAFIGWECGKVLGKTVSQHLSGLLAWHNIHGMPWAGEDSWVKMGRATAHKEGTEHQRDPQVPVSQEHLFALAEDLDETKSKDAAVLACAMSTTWAVRRLGKTTVHSAKKFSEISRFERCEYSGHREGRCLCSGNTFTLDKDNKATGRKDDGY
ncbi:hypothetical protein D9758_015155 [Tetrapyrgos nigripes]|uniref:Uncharacterized protein n=1 Tax=Tetrapyrgos nigripes TaxID=182062 RepID=A0A8H5CPR9_9AGAR|nr:hypothetical protein D9758_015155 [Tetrapyrgos nigripes]